MDFDKEFQLQPFWSPQGIFFSSTCVDMTKCVMTRM